MKIIIAAGIYPPDIGGPATYSQLIAKEFSKRGNKVKVICYSDSRSSEMFEMFDVRNEQFEQAERSNKRSDRTFKVIKISRRHNKLFRYFLYFWRLFKLSYNSDVIYAQGPLAAGLSSMWVKKILGKKFIIKIVGDYAWEQGVNQFNIKELIEEFQKKKYHWWVELMRIIQKTVAKNADKVIVPSEFLKKIVKGWGVSENKIEVIYNAFSKPKDIKFVKLEGDIIISAGRSEPWKGFNTLREIMPELKKENPKFNLIIATKLPHDELMGYFKASKMFVLNSGYEGLSHMILEAMAMGLPVITTDVCGNPELIKHGYNGLLVEYNNKKQLKQSILKLWRDKNLQKKFIENGKKTLEKFKLEEMINKTLEVLKS